MRCEVCGRKIHGKPVKALIEGAKLTVCGECAKYGTAVPEEPRQSPSPRLKPKTKPSKPTSTIMVEPQRAENVPLELVDDYDLKVRHAREKMGLTHEELGKKINEKVSVLKKIETRKIKPDNKLAAKLEHALKIKLLAPASEENAPAVPISKKPIRSLTLGDLIRLDEKGAEEKA